MQIPSAKLVEANPRGIAEHSFPITADVIIDFVDYAIPLESVKSRFIERKKFAIPRHDRRGSSWTSGTIIADETTACRSALNGESAARNFLNQSRH